MKRKPKYLHETPEDKQLRTVLISMVGSIFLCMACLIGTTWAWFQTSITSPGSVINVGNLEVAVALIRGDQADRDQITPSGQYTYKLTEVGTYSISLINSGSISGFCTVTLTDALGNEESFSTGTLNPTGEGLEDAATIELTVTPEDNINGILPVILKITPYWGEDPAYTIAEIDEEIFVPTEESTGPTYPADDSEGQGDLTGSVTPTEDNGDAEPENSGNDQPAVPETTVQTEPAVPETTIQTEPSEPEGTTEAADPAETEPTVPSTTAAATAPEDQSRTLDPSQPEDSTDTTETQ